MIKNILFIFFFVVLNSCSKKEKLHISETQSMIDDMFDEYFEAFSNKEFEKILDKYYDTPFIIYDQNNTIILNNRNELLSFLENVSIQLDKGNYGYSKTNFFEEFREDNNLIILLRNRIYLMSGIRCYKILKLISHHGNFQLTKDQTGIKNKYEYKNNS